MLIRQLYVRQTYGSGAAAGACAPAGAGSNALIARPTITTTMAPIRLCHRKATLRVHGEKATVNTTAMPAIKPQNAPLAVARLVRIASMKTPRREPKNKEPYPFT